MLWLFSVSYLKWRTAFQRAYIHRILTVVDQRMNINSIWNYPVLHEYWWGVQRIVYLKSVRILLIWKRDLSLLVYTGCCLSCFGVDQVYLLLQILMGALMEEAARMPWLLGWFDAGTFVAVLHSRIKAIWRVWLFNIPCIEWCIRLSAKWPSNVE